MKDFINKLKNYKFFDEFYVLVLAFIILMSWDWFFTFGTAIVIIIASIAIILFNNFKYLIPAGLFFVFSNRDGFSSTRFPIELIICFILMLAAVIYYMIKNKTKININNYKSIFGLFFLSIACFIPIMWSNIPDGNPVYYLVYLSYFLYLIIYFIFATNLGDDAFTMFKRSIIYLAIILAFECAIEIYTLKVNYPSLAISSVTYYSLGWGCCNEAGIIMLMALPFIFIDFVKEKDAKNIIISAIKLLLVGIGVVFTYSRGTYLFGFIELSILMIYTFFKTKNIKIYAISISTLALLFIISIQIMFGWPTFVYDIIINGVFNNRLSDSNRFELWNNALNIYNKNFKTLTFGSGVISEFATNNIRDGIAVTQVVYHSTIFEMLVTAGNFGIAFLIIHFIEKYKNLKFSYNNKAIFTFIMISYITTDLYGLIDNTYGMYYYMIPFVIMLAAFDVKN